MGRRIRAIGSRRWTIAANDGKSDHGDQGDRLRAGGRSGSYRPLSPGAEPTKSRSAVHPRVTLAPPAFCALRDNHHDEFIRRLGERVCSHSARLMDKRERQLENVRSGGAWSRQPWDYNLLDFMAFQQDGTGRLSVGYGQLVMGRAIFRYEVPRRGVLSLTFINAPENRRRRPAGLVPWSVDVVETTFVLRAGDFSGDMDTGTESGPFRYALTWALDLDRAPYPAWLDLPPGFFCS